MSTEDKKHCKKEQEKKQGQKAPKNPVYRRGIRLALGVMLLLPAAGLLILLTMEKLGERSLLTPGQYDVAEGETADTEPPEIIWNGDVYEYRDNLVTLLCLGVDGRETAVENTAIGFGPRADSIYLVVLDLEQEKLTILSISRDSMTSVHVFDSLGQDVGYYDMQLGIQYSNGDGLEQSCELTAAAVSRLLDGIPINGYCALYWRGIAYIHEVVTPVTAWVSEELQQMNPVIFPESGEVELTAEQGLYYVRSRDIWEDGSNETRSQRQREYIKALAAKGIQEIRRDPRKIFTVLRGIEEYVVTDLDAGECLALASWLKDWDLSDLDIRTLPGESRSTDFHDEYLVSPEEKKELLIELFYEKRY